MKIHDFADTDLENNPDDAAVGTEVWFVTASRFWPQLGADHYPWYVRTRVFLPDRFADWDAAMAKVAAALRERAAAHERLAFFAGKERNPLGA